MMAMARIKAAPRLPCLGPVALNVVRFFILLHLYLVTILATVSPSPFFGSIAWIPTACGIRPALRAWGSHYC